jgi:ATP-dependent helicase HrpB
VVVVAEPGAGKTTRVPPALLDVVEPHREVVVLEPRRLATRMAARRVAEEMGTRLGDTVGYQVRFEDVTSRATRLRFVTEAILVRQLTADPGLSRVGAVVLDELHERHIHTDLALVLLRRLQRTTRPDLKLVAMSATLDARQVSAFLGDCPVLTIPGRVFPVEVTFAPRDEPPRTGRPLERQVADAVRALVEGGLAGDVLCFLPGAAEIRRCAEACGPLARRAGMVVLPLHGDLSAEEQDRAVLPSAERKVILSTNVAETSVTIDGVVAVVDGGLARVASHAAWSGLPLLKLSKVSRDSAAQRSGRAGRTRPGVCVRLYTRHDHDARPEHTPPEIRRLDLAEPLLALRSLGIHDVTTLEWMDRPEPAQVEAADALLHRLGAVDEAGRLTEDGRAMLRFPLHPRQARVLLSCARRGHVEVGCQAAAILGERDPWTREHRPRHRALHGSDVWAVVEAMASRDEALDRGAVHRVRRATDQLRGLARAIQPGPRGEDAETALGLALLTGFPDRVATRRVPGKGSTARAEDVELLLASGGTARLSPSSAVRDSDWLVALDAEERHDGAREQVTVTRASAVSCDWLLDVVPEALTLGDEVEWNRDAARVDAFSRVRVGALVVSESRVDAVGVPGTAALLAREALAAGLHTLCDPEDLSNLRARVALLHGAFPEKEIPLLDDARLQERLLVACQGKKSLAQLREDGLLRRLEESLGPEVAHLLRKETPDVMTLPGGRRTRIHYVAGQPPHVSSRLQDFFGTTTTPRIAGGRVLLNLHLLAPNGREVQITQDLQGFWDRHYPALRRELMRRYPKHAWPEDPVTARPPVGGRVR